MTATALSLRLELAPPPACATCGDPATRYTLGGVVYAGECTTCHAPMCEDCAERSAKRYGNATCKEC